MSKALLIPTVLVLMCSGCLHSPPNYPGAGGKNIDPATFADAVCPDLEGKYEGQGELIDGDATAKGWAKSKRIDYVFPFANSEDAMKFMNAAARVAAGHVSYPRYGEIKMLENRAYSINVSYENGKSASHIFLLGDKNRFVCTGVNGKIIWGGASKGGRSEFGPNTSDSMAILYLDDQGDLIAEKSTQIHMSMLLGAIPTGTAKHFSKYRFKRIR